MEKPGSPSVAWMYGIVIAVALAIFGVGIFLAVQEAGKRDWTMLAAGCLGLLIVLTALPMAIASTTARAALLRKQEELNTVLTERLQAITVLMNEISEQQLISDRTKAVAYREKDRDALRRAIREDIAKRDWETALVLAEDMEKVFGYRQEAMKFREDIYRSQEEVIKRQVADGRAVIERHCRAEMWSDALREAERLMATFKGEPNVAKLPQEIESRRQAHKQQLIDTWNEALKRNDIDGAIEILKKLDLYLTRAEGESMQDTVRTLFKEKLNNLKTQFTLAMQDHKHGEAVRLAEVIIRDFPNSGIARELREKIDALRQRATEQPVGAGI